MAPAATSCHACGKSGCKLLRCGRCRNVWFCNRECQVVAARQGHSGANCRPAEEAATHTDAEAEEASGLPAAAGPSHSPPLTSTMAAATSCHTCGKSGCKLLRCGRCRNVWFCNRECQVIAARQGHSGASRRAADGAPTHEVAEEEVAEEAPRLPAAMAANESCHTCGQSGGTLLRCGRCRSVWFCNRECQAVGRSELGHRGANCRPAAQPPTPMKVGGRIDALTAEADNARLANSRSSLIAAVEKYREAAAVADIMGGARGAGSRANTDELLADCLRRLNDMPAAARAACSSLRAARASEDRSLLVKALLACADVARESPGEMAQAEKESREQERLSTPPPVIRRPRPLAGRADQPADHPRRSLPTGPRIQRSPRSPSATPHTQPAAAATASLTGASGR